MIFVTVGGQMPFDRLIQSVDEWHLATHSSQEILFQIGDGQYIPRSGEYVRFLQAREFIEYVKAASVVVAHAGMGSILTALELAKPILVLPRLGSLAETRNDHQTATAKALAGMKKVHAAFNEEELHAKLSRIDELKESTKISPWASSELQEAVEQFINGNEHVRAVNAKSDSQGFN